MWRADLCRNAGEHSVCVVPGLLPGVIVCGKATQSYFWRSEYVFLLLTPGMCGLEPPAGANRGFLSSVPSPLTNEMVLLSAEPQFLQQDWLMEGCDFPAAIPP